LWSRAFVCVCLSAAAFSHYCTDPDASCNLGSGRGCSLVVQYWADLQSVHRLRCYGNITRTRNVSEYVLVLALCLVIIIFCVSRRRREMYCGHARLCVCLTAAACPHYCMDPDVTLGSSRGCSLVVHYWEDLQSVHGLRCYGNIT